MDTSTTSSFFVDFNDKTNDKNILHESRRLSFGENLPSIDIPPVNMTDVTDLMQSAPSGGGFFEMTSQSATDSASTLPLPPDTFPTGSSSPWQIGTTSSEQQSVIRPRDYSFASTNSDGRSRMGSTIVNALSSAPPMLFDFETLFDPQNAPPLIDNLSATIPTPLGAHGKTQVPYTTSAFANQFSSHEMDVDINMQYPLPSMCSSDVYMNTHTTTIETIKKWKIIFQKFLDGTNVHSKMYTPICGCCIHNYTAILTPTRTLKIEESVEAEAEAETETASDSSNESSSLYRKRRRSLSENDLVNTTKYQRLKPNTWFNNGLFDLPPTIEGHATTIKSPPKTQSKKRSARQMEKVNLLSYSYSYSCFLFFC